MTKRYRTQSIAISEDEEFIIRVLAKMAGIKPATVARQLLFRGLEGFLKDNRLTASSLEEDIRSGLLSMIGTQAAYARIVDLVRSELEEEVEAKSEKRRSKVVSMPSRTEPVYKATDEKSRGRNRRSARGTTE